MNYYNNDDDLWGCGIAIALWAITIIINIALIAGFVWFVIYMLERAGAFG